MTTAFDPFGTSAGLTRGSTISIISSLCYLAYIVFVVHQTSNATCLHDFLHRKEQMLPNTRHFHQGKLSNSRNLLRLEHAKPLPDKCHQLSLHYRRVLVRQQAMLLAPS